MAMWMDGANRNGKLTDKEIQERFDLKDWMGNPATTQNGVGQYFANFPLTEVARKAGSYFQTKDGAIHQIAGGGEDYLTGSKHDYSMDKNSSMNRAFQDQCKLQDYVLEKKAREQAEQAKAVAEYQSIKENGTAPSISFDAAKERTNAPIREAVEEIYQKSEALSGYKDARAIDKAVNAYVNSKEESIDNLSLDVEKETSGVVVTKESNDETLDNISLES